MACKVAYRRAKHAGHYAHGGGHDLEIWDVTAESMANARIAVSCMAEGEEYWFGYVDAVGDQHWVFSKRAPFSEGTCETCPLSVDDRQPEHV